VFFALTSAVLLVIWLVILVGGLAISAVSVASGVVYYVRHKSTGPVARLHFALTIVAGVVGLVLVAVAILGAYLVTNSAG
jgi:hypothetical protein